MLHQTFTHNARRFMVLALLTLSLLVGATASADVPLNLSHQGRLLDLDNNPIAGVQSLSFTLYDGPESNTLLWTETLNVVLDNGYYTVVLGQTESIPANIFTGATLYLGVRVGDDDELRPRLRITSVPYAVRAGEAENAVGDITPNSVTVGDSMVIDEDGRWVGDATDLQGPQGEAGPQGEPGVAGEAGLQGEAGPQGEPGEAGPQGEAGADAAPDDVAMALSLDDNFRNALATALSEQHADALRGMQGEPGAPGEAGAQGEPGEAGPQGEPGADASAEDIAAVLVMDNNFRDALAMVIVDQYADVLRGAQGEPGEAGPQGEPGEAGPQGEPGADASPDDVATALVNNEDFRDMLASTLAADYADELRGETGQDGANGLPTGGLMLQLEFDEIDGTEFADSAPLGNNAIAPVSGIAPGSGGHSNRSINFSGGAVVIPQGNTLPDSAQVWVEAWLQPALPLDETRLIASKEGAWDMRQDGDKLSFRVYANNADCTVIHPTSVEPGVWVHVAGWYNGLRVEAAVNGRSVAADCTEGPLLPTLGEPLFVGGQISGNNDVNEAYAGRIDELRVRQVAPASDSLPPTPFAGSVLLDAPEQSWINNRIGNPYQTWQRCYRKTVDGASSTTFHAQCDHRGPSVTVFELANGKKLGAYAEGGWSTNWSGYRASHQAFLFSLTEEKFYPLGYSYDNALYTRSNYGPTFGNGHDIYINASMDLGYCNFPYAYSCNGRSANSPTDECTQELCGLNRSQANGINELEVWVLR